MKQNVKSLPDKQEVLKTFLATMATTEDASWIFYVVALFQVSVAVLHLEKRFRLRTISTILLLVSALPVPLLLIAGF